MSAIASPVMYVPSRPTSTKFVGSFYNLELLEKILAAVVDDDLYDTPEEQRPSITTITRTAAFLNNALPVEYLQHLEIDPSSGKINITWRDRQLGRRVKVTFLDYSISLYHEQKNNDCKAEYDLLRLVRAEDVNYWVRWCFGSI
ncbi:MAG TPA: hypothetical protein VKZ53_27105 [Candidatus Angelobacter sp.]|nr:hypothetical protein [Candidatus Angelobacter sp.]